MAKCPLCAAQIPDDFGLIECGSCGAQLLVHMDGRVEYSGAKELPVEEPEAPVEDLEAKTHFAFEESPRELDYNTKAGFTEALQVPVDEPPEPEEIVVAEVPESEALQVSLSPAPHAEEEQDFSFEDVAAVTPEQKAAVAEPEPPPFAEEPAPAVEPEPVPPEATEFVNIIPPDEMAPTEVYRGGGAAAEVPVSPEMLDVARFGNSSASSARDGSLRYNLHVTGIDTVDVRENFREAITDRKLIWDIEEILRSIKNGEVRINNVPAAKAYIVVTRLRELPVKVKWEQYAIAQS